MNPVTTFIFGFNLYLFLVTYNLRVEGNERKLHLKVSIVKVEGL